MAEQAKRRKRGGGRAGNAKRRGSAAIEQMPWNPPLNIDAPVAPLDAAGVHRAADLAALCAGSDVLSLHAVPGPRPLLDAAGIARMRRGAILVNTARGALVDEAALAAALRSGHLRAAGLDVTATEPLPAGSPLLAAPGLVLTPHIGGAAETAIERTGLEVARRVLAALGLPAG